LASQNAQARLEQQRSREELRLKKLENQEKEAKLEHKIQDNKKHLSSMVQVQQKDQANALAAAKKLSVLEAQSAAAKDTRKAADQTAIDAARRFQDAKANELQAEAIELQKKRLAQKKKLEAKVAVLQLAAKKKNLPHSWRQPRPKKRSKPRRRSPQRPRRQKKKPNTNPRFPKRSSK
jgi:hypothetical protein